MARVTIRIDDALHDRLQRRARSLHLTVAELLRPAIDQAADPRSGYVYTTQDEILSGVLQTLAIVAASIRRRSPEALEEGMADARQMLLDRGLLPPEQRS
ncbi:ribbon-helix-helix protein, CopG family [uncultured Sphingomonas sp.]|uniref:ribbon-helix-helix protein, CopG family n=1 Tax=uncultured Sphingomonas sp. TaxID=158754 RepID=UPI00260F4372|nr:ribbon-helix-helix protein, CopG family [uncultured Sphingomonas sp.]